MRQHQLTGSEPQLSNLDLSRIQPTTGRFARRAVRPTRRRGRIAVMLSVALALVFGTCGLAFASGTWGTTAYEGCSTSWTYNPYGGTSATHEQYTADTSNHSHYVVTNGKAWVDSMIDCGPGGYNIYADHINLTVTYTVYGSNLSCSISVPASFSCSANYTNETFTYTTTCGTDVYGCLVSFSTLYFYAPAGGTLNRGILMQTQTQLVRSDGHSDVYQTQGV